MNAGLIIGALELGGIYAVMAVGIYITYKILDFPDLTVDGSFPLGGAITSVMLAKGFGTGFTMLTVMIAGALAGLCTGFIHVKCKVRDLLSGIIVMTALYSVNFIIVGKANMPVTNATPTVFSNDLILSLFGNKANQDAPLYFMRDYRMIIILVIFIIAVKLLVDLFLKTKCGYLLRATGDNPSVVATLAKNSGNMKILGLVIAHVFVALSGSLFCQYNKAFNLTDGTGKVVIGLAAVIIGINIFGRIKFLKPTTAVVIGSVIYTACVAIALKQFDSNVKNLVTAILFLIVLVLGQQKFGGKNKKVGKAVSQDVRA